jgi:hypothetical protein
VDAENKQRIIFQETFGVPLEQIDCDSRHNPEYSSTPYWHLAFISATGYRLQEGDLHNLRQV